MTLTRNGNAETDIKYRKTENYETETIHPAKQQAKTGQSGRKFNGAHHVPSHLR